jgi:hypothetical protein
MNHHLFTIAIFIVALVLYGVGMTSGASVCFAVGAVCELWFWGRLLRLRRASRNLPKQRCVSRVV